MNIIAWPIIVGLILVTIVKTVQLRYSNNLSVDAAYAGSFLVFAVIIALLT